MADLGVSLERMRKYGLRMNPLKCAFGAKADRFLEFVVHEHGIQVDQKKVESIKRLGEPTCKRDVKKLLGKINYLRRFITNFSTKVESFFPLICLKHEEGFVWGEEQKAAFEKIKEYLTMPPVLQPPKASGELKLYVAAQEWVIGVVLLEEDKGREFLIAYISRWF
jgi:hypothetical protein